MLIANSDQIVDMNIADYINDSDNRNLDGSVLCFEDNDTKWSYAKLDGKGLITEIREKEVISEHATVGIYYFKKGSDFVENAIDMFVERIIYSYLFLFRESLTALLVIFFSIARVSTSIQILSVSILSFIVVEY